MHEKTHVQRRQYYRLLKHRWARLLHNMIEGKPLRESRRVPSQHDWVDSGTMLLSVRSFIWANKLRSGGMPTNCWLQRGWRGERSCRNLSGVLQRKGCEIKWEPHVKTAEGLRKPDLVFVMGRLALVIGAHMVGDNFDMMAVHEAKIQKYSDNPGIDADINSKPGVAKVRHCPLIINSREFW